MNFNIVPRELYRYGQTAPSPVNATTLRALIHIFMSRISHCQSAQWVRYRKEELELSFASGKGDFSLCYRVQTGSRGCGGGRGHPAFYPLRPGGFLTEGKLKEAWHSPLYSILARQLRRTGAKILKTGHGAPVGVQSIAKWYIQGRHKRKASFNMKYIPSCFLGKFLGVVCHCFPP